MNEATAIGIIIFVPVLFIAALFGWLEICSNFMDNHYDLPFIVHLSFFLSPLAGIGLIFLCYGLVVQPIINPPKEEPMKTFRTDEDRRLAEHLFNRSMKLLIKHYRNGDSIDKDIIYVINTYENLNGEVENEDDEY